MYELNVFAKEQSTIQIAAKPFAMQQVPEVLFVHDRVAMWDQQIGIEPVIHRRKNGDVQTAGKPKSPRGPWRGIGRVDQGDVRTERQPGCHPSRQAPCKPELRCDTQDPNQGFEPRSPGNDPHPFPDINQTPPEPPPPPPAYQPLSPTCPEASRQEKTTTKPREYRNDSAGNQGERVRMIDKFRYRLASEGGWAAVSHRIPGLGADKIRRELPG